MIPSLSLCFSLSRREKYILHTQTYKMPCSITLANASQCHTWKLSIYSCIYCCVRHCIELHCIALKKVIGKSLSPSLTTLPPTTPPHHRRINRIRTILLLTRSPSSYLHDFSMLNLCMIDLNWNVTNGTSSVINVLLHKSISAHCTVHTHINTPKYTCVRFYMYTHTSSSKYKWVLIVMQTNIIHIYSNVRT